MPPKYTRPPAREEAAEGQPSETMAEEKQSEPTSIFLTKEQVGREVKAGDTLTFTVQDIDPQTGEIEATQADSSEEKPAPTEDIGESPMDKMDAMKE